MYLSGQKNDAWPIIIGNDICPTDVAKYKIHIRRKTDGLNIEGSLKIAHSLAKQQQNKAKQSSSKSDSLYDMD